MYSNCSILLFHSALISSFYSYPAVYIFCVFPVGLVRFLDFRGHFVPPAATIFSSFLFSSSGFLNTILYVITRPELVKGATPEVADAEGYEMGAERNPGKPVTQKRIQKVAKPIHHHFGHLPDRDLGPSSSSGGKVYSYEQDDRGWTPTTDYYSGHLGSDGPGSSHGLGHLPERDEDPGHLPDLDSPGTLPRNPRGMPLSPSFNDEQHQTPLHAHQKLVSLDLGFLPESNTPSDFVHDRDHGSPTRSGWTKGSSVPPLATYQHR